MGEGTVYLLVRRTVSAGSPDWYLVGEAIVRAFRDRLEAECEMQRLRDAGAGKFRRTGGLRVRDEYRVEEVALG